MFSREDSHASRSPMPGSEEARKMTATSGRRCCEQYKSASQLGSLVRMLAGSQRWLSKARLLRWEIKPLFSERRTVFIPTKCDKDSLLSGYAPTSRVSDMKSNRFLFRLVPLEHRTDETESSSSDILLQTPTVVMTDESPETMRARAERNGYKNGTQFASLASQVRYDERVQAMLLPTPMAVEREHPERVDALKESGATQINSRVNGSARPNGIVDYLRFFDLLKTPCAWDAKEGMESDNTPHSSGTLAQQAMMGKFDKLLPTCRANQANPPMNEKMASRNKSNLEEEVAKMVQGLIPTPTAHCWKDGTASDHPALNRDLELNHWVKRREETLEMTLDSEDDGSTSHLSPLFTEEMMGFPLMWTALPFLSINGDKKHSRHTEMQ